MCGGFRSLRIRSYNQSNAALSATAVLFNASGTAQWVAAHISAGTSPGTVDVDLSKAPAGHGPPLAVRGPSQPFWLRASIGWEHASLLWSRIAGCDELRSHDIVLGTPM